MSSLFKTGSAISLLKLPIKENNPSFSSIDEVDETDYSRIHTKRRIYSSNNLNYIYSDSMNNVNSSKSPINRKKFPLKFNSLYLRSNSFIYNNKKFFLTNDSPSMKILFSQHKHEKLVNSLKKKFKLDNLKNEMVIKEQLNYYSPNEYFEPTNLFSAYNFVREIKSRNKYEPAMIYDKNEIFSKENPIKYGFRSFVKSSSNEKSNILKNLHLNKSNRKKNKFCEIIKELKKNSKIIFQKNQELSQTIRKRKLKESLIEGHLIYEKKKKKKKEPYDFSHLIRKEKSVLINYDKLLRDNGKNVKLYLEPSNYKYVDQAINQLKNEERLLHKKLEGNNEYDIKSKFLLMLNDFKRVAFINMNLKEQLNLGNFYSKPKESEVQKMKRKMEKVENIMDDNFLKTQIKRQHVLRSIQERKAPSYKPKKLRVKAEDRIIKFYI